MTLPCPSTPSIVPIMRAHTSGSTKSINNIISGEYKELLPKIKKTQKPQRVRFDDRGPGGLNLRNVVFMPLQPIGSLNRFLNMADIHLILQKGNMSDCVMPSKLTTILSVGGVAIISARLHSSLYNFVEQNGIGILIEPENQNALTSAIQATVTGKTEGLRQNARNYAEQFLSIDKIMPNYATNLN